MIGKFGIGFFSVFMLGDEVEVVTRRFDKAFQDTLVLSFSTGTSKRPILRPASQGEWLIDGGTSVRVWLKTPPRSLKEFFGEHDARSLRDLCDRQFPTLDVRLQVNDGENETIIEPINWVSADPLKLIKKVSGSAKIPKQLKSFLTNMRPLLGPQGEVVGRMFLAPSSYNLGSVNAHVEGVLVARGIEAGRVNGLYGVVESNVTRASRFKARPVVSKENFRRWLNNQAVLLTKMKLTPSMQLKCVTIIRSLGGDISGLKFCRSDTDWFSVSEFNKYIDGRDEIFITSDFTLNSLNEMNPDATVRPNIVAIGSGGSIIFNSSDWHYDEEEDALFRDKDDDGSIEGFIIRKIVERWNLDPLVVDVFNRSVVDEKVVHTYTKETVADDKNGKEIKAVGRKLWRKMKITDFVLRLAPDDEDEE
jgi:hypothetical protein